ncbi:MAG: transcription elongation factor GreA [Patescibacteria group bacterium]
MDTQYFSKEGLEKLKQELFDRTENVRPEIARRIREAKEQGDLSENAEYSEAKEAQAINEGRIEELKAILENAVIIDDDRKRGGIVAVGASVKVESKLGAHTYTIVGPAESDPAQGFISNESPLGSAFLGRKKGDSVDVKTPKGLTTYKIVDVK